MKYPESRYEYFDGGLVLKLYSWDGLVREVTFHDSMAAVLALSPGKAYLDSNAVVGYRFLPTGATYVSEARSTDYSNASSPAIDQVVDTELRLLKPIDAKRHDAMNADMRQRHEHGLWSTPAEQGPPN